MKKLIITTGHFGSGKTEVSLHLAEKLKETSTLPIFLCDLDVINPYFRSRDYEKQLVNMGVHLVAPKGELSKADLPIVTGEVYSVLNKPDSIVIMDIGGDKDGAMALGQFSHIIKQREHDVIFVANSNRPYVNSVEGILECIQAIEKASRLNVTGIINNTHLGEEMVDPESVLEGEAIAKQAAKQLEIPFYFSAVSKDSWSCWKGEGILPQLEKVEILERKLLTPWSV